MISTIVSNRGWTCELAMLGSSLIWSESIFESQEMDLTHGFLTSREQQPPPVRVCPAEEALSLPKRTRRTWSGGDLVLAS